MTRCATSQCAVGDAPLFFIGCASPLIVAVRLPPPSGGGDECAVDSVGGAAHLSLVLEVQEVCERMQVAYQAWDTVICMRNAF